MLVRLWWKDARQFWPIWVFLGLIALGVQWTLLIFLGQDAKTGVLGTLALSWAALYACAVGAAAIAGEKENKTLAFLDGQGLSRATFWRGKASFAAVSTIVLAATLFGLAALGTDRWEIHGGVGLWLIVAFGAAVLLEVLGWGLLWSSLTTNPLLAAVLAVLSVLFSLAVASPVPAFGRPSDTTINMFTQVALLKLAIAFATASASYCIVVSGQPGRRGARPEGTRIGPMTISVAPRPIVTRAPSISTARSARRRLIWQTWREAVPVCWRFAGLYLVATVLVGFIDNVINIPSFLLAVSWPIGLIAGICVFGTSHPGRTYRFLCHHAARPGQVWRVKVGVWAVLLGLLACAVTPFALFVEVLLVDRFAPTDTTPYLWKWLPIFISLTFTAPVGMLCGMVIRRGITAAVGAAALLMLLAMPLGMLVSQRMLPTWGLAAVPMACFVISWAWSADWMYDRPGAGRWLRLAAYSIVMGCVLCTSYIGLRIYGVPSVDPARLAQYLPKRIQDEEKLRQENAYRLYQEALSASRTATDDNSYVLGLIRRASSLPFWHSPALDRWTLYHESTHREWVKTAGMLLATSAEARLGKGDLTGSWDDILALLRVARHACQGVPVGEARQGLVLIEQRGLSLALRWAADPKQSPATLKTALDSFQALPPMPGPAEMLAIEAEVTDRTLQRPQARLVDLLLGDMRARRGVDIQAALMTQFITTPWEVARARRLARSIFTSYAVVAAMPAWKRSGTSGEGLRVVLFEDLIASTPIVRHFLVNPDPIISLTDHNEAARRGVLQVLALRRYQLQHDGRLPLMLQDLVHEGELSELPIDPYSGQLFQYRPAEGQLVLPLSVVLALPSAPAPEFESSRGMRLLYSVGEDRSDNGGSSGSNDLVFPLPDKPGAVPDPPQQSEMPEGMGAMIGGAAGASPPPVLPDATPTPPR